MGKYIRFGVGRRGILPFGTLLGPSSDLPVGLWEIGSAVIPPRKSKDLLSGSEDSLSGRKDSPSGRGDSRLGQKDVLFGKAEARLG